MRLSILLTISLAACASTPPPFVPAKTVTIKEFVYPDCGNPPQRSPVELRSLSWRVLPDAKGEQRFTLSAKGYEDLGFNTSEILKGAKELKAELQYYIACVNAH